jgi:hypothetical protein
MPSACSSPVATRSDTWSILRSIEAHASLNNVLVGMQLIAINLVRDPVGSTRNVSLDGNRSTQGDKDRGSGCCRELSLASPGGIDGCTRPNRLTNSRRILLRILPGNSRLALRRHEESSRRIEHHAPSKRWFRLNNTQISFCTTAWRAAISWHLRSNFGSGESPGPFVSHRYCCTTSSRYSG